MTVATCNKCGEQRELVFAGCVCGICSDALDERWVGSAAGDWVLIAKQPVEKVGETPWDALSVATVFGVISKLYGRERGPETTGVSPKESAADIAPMVASLVVTEWPPLDWLSAPSPAAELFGRENGAGFCLYVYPDTNYAQMKLHWAKPNPTTNLIIGGALVEDISNNLSEQFFATYLSKIGVTSEQFQALQETREMSEVSRAQLAKWWQAGMDGYTDIRHATPEEIGTYNALLRDQKRHEQTARILKKWGFDINGAPIAGFIDDDEWKRRGLQAWEEIRRIFEGLGLLEGSLFDYEEELRASHLKYHNGGTVQAHTVPNTVRGLSRVAGMTGLKEQLMHEVIGPFKDPDLYRRYRVTLPNGILFYGPPGCGKTYIARSLADELGWHFQYCRPFDVASPYIHDTVSRIRAVFSTAIEKAPSIVFIDEFEAFVPARSQLGGHQQYKAEEVNEFLANLEGCAERRVLVIAATNEPERIDPAVRRSGRFDKLILIPPPDADARRAMLEFHLADRPVDGSLDIAGIAAVLEGYSASDIKLLVDEAARMALKRADLITTSTLLAALERVAASITAEDMQRYDAFRSRGTG